MGDTNLVLGGKEFSSRLIVGTGKYSSMEVMKEAHEASGAQIITVALRRVSLPSGGSILDHLDTTRCCRTPPAATTPTRRYAPAIWRARPGSARW
jgi:thiazole synthase